MKKYDIQLDVAGVINRVDKNGTVWVASMDYKKGQPFSMLVSEVSDSFPEEKLDDSF